MTTAQKTMPGWWVQVRACEKTDIFACTKQSDQPLIGKAKLPCSHHASGEKPPAAGGELSWSPHSS